MRCACGSYCIPDLAVPWATLMPVTKCGKMKYCMRGTNIYHISGRFTVNLTSSQTIHIDATKVDILLFYYSMFIKYQYTICTDGCGVDWHDKYTTVFVSDNSIQYCDQYIEPYCAFKASNGLAVFNTGDRCGLVQFIAISMALNGEHLIY
jgi:hypothetical protein